MSVSAAPNARNRQLTEISAARGRVAGSSRRERGDAPCRQREPDSAADDEEHQPFGGQLAHETAAAGADRSSHRKLASSRAAARNREAGHVDARDQQHEADGDEQDDQILPGTGGHIFGEARHANRHGRIAVGVGVGKALANDGQLLTGRLLAHAVA